MNPSEHHRSGGPSVGAVHKRRILEEIAYFEARLIEIGHSGDCAYEKALARTYRNLLDDRRWQLSQLDS